MIAKPVRYDQLTECLVTADGEYINLNIDGKTQRQNAVANEIVAAINREPEWVAVSKRMPTARAKSVSDGPIT